jgi:prepilin-type N-terminal cleavage/methylation domain-containing protein
MNTNSTLQLQPVLTRRPASRRGYTLMELIVVLGVLAFIGVLAGAYAPNIISNASDRQKRQVAAKMNETLLAASAAGINISAGSATGIDSTNVGTIITSLTGGTVTSPVTGIILFRPVPNAAAYTLGTAVNGVPQLSAVTGQPGVTAIVE